MPYRRVVETVDNTGAWAPIFCQAFFLDLIFLGSQTCFFFLTTAPQSLHRNRPDLGFADDSPFLQLITSEIISQVTN